VLQVIFTLHRYGRSLGLDVIIVERNASRRVSGGGGGMSGRWLNVLT
jgi:hypothetical protein